MGKLRVAVVAGMLGAAGMLALLAVATAAPGVPCGAAACIDIDTGSTHAPPPVTDVVEVVP